MKNSIFCLLFLSFTVLAIAQNEKEEEKKVPGLDKVTTAALKLERNLIVKDIEALESDIAELNTLSADLATTENIDPKDKQRVEIEMQSSILKLEKRNLQLTKIDAQLDGNELNTAQKEVIEKRSAEIDEELKLLKEEDKALANDQRLEDGDRWELELKRADLYTRLKSAEYQLKLRGKKMKVSKRLKLEKEVKALKEQIELYNQRIEEME